MYSGHHHTFCHSTLVWTDVYGIIIRLDSCLQGSTHDRKLYNDSEPYRNPTQYFTDDESVIADTGFQGDGAHIIFPMKRNQCRSFHHRSDMNRDIRKQRIRNEWSVGLITNRFRLFLGRWSLESELFKVMFNVAGMLVNHRIRKGDVRPVPLERMLDRIELYERGEL